MSVLTQYDTWLADYGPAALVLREYLVPAAGPDGVLFPASFAPEEGADRDPSKFQGGYNIDVYPKDEDVSAAAGVLPKEGKPLRHSLDRFPATKNICLVDSGGHESIAVNRRPPKIFG